MKHTKGEWKTSIHERKPEFRPLVVDDSGCQIAAINENQPEFEANAKLIAAAPKMLEVVYQLMTDKKVKVSLLKLISNNETIDHLSALREAIQKATD